MSHTPVPHYKADHSHCWTKENPPCGIEGKHRCCLCNELVPETDTTREDTNKIVLRVLLNIGAINAHYNVVWSDEQIESFTNGLHQQLQKAREEGAAEALKSKHEHNYIFRVYEKPWAGSNPPPTMFCTKCGAWD